MSRVSIGAPGSTVRHMPGVVAMMASGLVAATFGLCAAPPALAHDSKAILTVDAVLASSKPSDWIPVPTDDMLYIKLPRGRVIIRLAPAFAPQHVANIRTLAREHYWDGLAIFRVQDNFVAEWGDPASVSDRPARLPPTTLPPRSLGSASTALPPEFVRNISPDPPFIELSSRDSYAPQVGFINGFPAARNPVTGKEWLVNCYGMVGVARGDAPNSGSGATLYAVIGQAPRQLDQNVTVVGRVVQGMKYLSELRRGNGPLGVYETAAHRTQLVRATLGPYEAHNKLGHWEVLRAGTRTFAKWLELQRYPSSPWFHYRSGSLGVCDGRVPVRVVK